MIWWYMGTSWQLLFQFCTDPFETLHVFYSWYEDVHVFVCLCWGFTAQSTQWGHVERSQFT